MTRLWWLPVLRMEAGQRLPLGMMFAAGVLVAVLGVGLLELDRLPFSLCAFKLATGWPCLSCGTTRALGRLFARDVPGAIRMNPLATLGALAVVPWALADVLMALRGRRLSLTVSPALTRLLQIAAILAAAANWLFLVLAGR